MGHNLGHQFHQPVTGLSLSAPTQNIPVKTYVLLISLPLDGVVDYPDGEDTYGQKERLGQYM